MSEWSYYRYGADFPSQECECVIIVDENNNTIAKRILGKDYPEQYPFIKDAHNKICRQYKKEIEGLKKQLNELRNKERSERFFYE